MKQRVGTLGVEGFILKRLIKSTGAVVLDEVAPLQVDAVVRAQR